MSGPVGINGTLTGTSLSRATGVRFAHEHELQCQHLNRNAAHKKAAS